MISFSALIAVAGATAIVAGAVVWILHPWSAGAAPCPGAEGAAPAAGAPEGMDGAVLAPAAAS